MTDYLAGKENVQFAPRREYHDEYLLLGHREDRIHEIVRIYSKSKS
jgi:hypothetical protein